MANPEHVEIVEQGAEAIAGWRRDHRGERLDLKGVNLRRAHLANANLRGAHLGSANLRGADLRWGNLRGAHLGGAHLRGVHLPNANLRRADLFRADLSGANLREARLPVARLGEADLSRADLSGADLTLADLRNADLREADLTKALLSETVFGDTDLSGVKGLKSVRHGGPSMIDERTLRKSWPLPETFLRGCGLSDELISFMGATLGKAIEFYSCFISYSSKDQDFADRLHADLQDNGVRCWFAPEDMKIGDRTRLRIDESIKLHDKLLLILSEHSVASQWVEQEVETALGKERKGNRTVLFPIRVDDSVMEIDGGWAALIKNSRHIGDFRRWRDHDAYLDSFERLLRDLKSGAGEADGA